MTEKWLVKKTLGESGPYAVADKYGRIIAAGIPDHGNALLIAQLPQLKELRYDWAVIINRLAHVAKDGQESSNDGDYAQDMIDMVRPYLGCAFIEMGEVDDFDEGKQCP